MALIGGLVLNMKKLQNDFTTPEQSKRLLELGVPEWTANWKLSKLVKDSHGQKPKDKHDWAVNRKDYTHMIVGFMKYDYLPCWSVGRLIEIFELCSGVLWQDTAQPSVKQPTLIERAIDTIVLFNKCGHMDFSKLED